MTTTTIDSDLESLWQKLGQMPALLNDSLGETALLASDAARATAPRRTGKLAASVTVTRGGDGNSVAVKASTPYASFVLYGTRFMKANPFLQVAVARALRALGPRLQQRIG